MYQEKWRESIPFVIFL